MKLLLKFSFESDEVKVIGQTKGTGRANNLISHQLQRNESTNPLKAIESDGARTIQAEENGQEVIYTSVDKSAFKSSVFE